MSADWPPAEELLHAVREFLEADVMSSTSGRTQYLTRVAMNILATVERELRDGAVESVQREVFGRFQAGDEGELCERIRSGALDDHLAEVANALRPLVHQRLSIANPRYIS